MDKSFIYMDNAATTRMLPEVFEEMKPYFMELYGNASSVYQFGVKAKNAVEAAREQIGSLIGAAPEEIYFTGGGSESDNWAIRNAAEMYQHKGRHIITSSIEHHAVLHTCEYLEKQGYEISYLPVDEEGKVSVDAVAAAIREDTILITIMAANNEIGTIEPITEIGRLAHEKGILFHTDAVQAYGHIPLDVNAMNIDMLSGSGHKIHGPKGIGFLYVRRGIKLAPLIYGGAQERGKRGGTINTAGIIGFAKAAESAQIHMDERNRKTAALRDRLIDRVLEEIPYVRLNGPRKDRLPNNANFCFRFIEGESLLIMLDMNGICGSSGSACTSGSLDPSHVLLAIGLPHEIAHGSLRLTLSEENTEEQVDYTVDKLKEIVSRLRDMSPLYEDFMKENKKNV